ncbi:MAG: pyridoxamine 5'-phosphate oxidase family protein [Methyloligellaceae bacterium]
MSSSPFHQGERAVQERFGVRDRLEKVGRRLIRDHMPDQHRTFFAGLPLVFAASVDAAGRPWASLLAGPPGFMQSPDPRTLVIAAEPLPGDPLGRALAPGARLGLLGLEHHTRRRNRLNGTVARLSPGRIEVRVEQSIGNCPKYINSRHVRWRPAPEADAAPIVTDHLTERARDFVTRADTLYIATSFRPESTERRHGVDMSHRGGLPGFVGVAADGTLAVPDYSGNNFFNTLGNILEDGRCGLMFLDFENGDVLQLTGEAHIDWRAEAQDDAKVKPRTLKVRPVEFRVLPAVLPLAAELLDYSPYLSPDGAG